MTKGLFPEGDAAARMNLVGREGRYRLDFDQDASVGGELDAKRARRRHTFDLDQENLWHCRNNFGLCT
jgi:hypothetical protein